MHSKRAIIIDGNSLFFRAYYAIKANMSAVIADGIWNVECEVVATFLCSDTQQLTILWLGEVLFEVHVKCRTTS